MVWEDTREVDAEIRRDRMLLVAAQPENSQKIFQSFKTSAERKKSQDINSLDHLRDDDIEETDDEGLRDLFSQLSTVGYGVQDVED